MSSFGLSGTNAHIVLEAHSPVTDVPVTNTHPNQLLPLSAKSKPALIELAGRYHNYLAAQPTTSLADLCYTAQCGRKHFNHRLGLVVTSREALQAQLAAFAAGEMQPSVRYGYAPQQQGKGKIAWLFTGQGAQYEQMARELYDSQLIFRQTVDQCAAILQPYLDTPLLDVLYLNTDNSALIHQTAYTQPALFTVEYALAKLWQSWGVQPDIVLGHSVGEVVAACVAGVFSLEDGLRLIAARGRLMQALPQDGDMVAVLADEAEVQASIADEQAEVSIAAVNDPAQVVISGRRTAIQRVVNVLQDKAIKTRSLPVSHAFHSPLMEPMLAAFAAVAETITYSQPRIAFVSNLTGQFATTEVTQPAYWVRHVREAVRFADSIKTLYTQGITFFFERFAGAVCPDLFPDYGDLPHEKDGEKVYHSTPYPADRSIHFHNESSHMHQWPRKQFFYCVQAAKEGGATPLVDGRKVYQLLRPELREKFAQKKLMYTRNFTKKLDVSWSEFFHTTDRAEVEAYCRKANIGFEWKEDDVLKTYQIRPALIKHPKTGEAVFFNQIQIHHISCLEAAVRESLTTLWGEDDLPRNVYFGDGTPITDAEMDEVRALYDQLAVRSRWQSGDIVMVDNMLVSHGRDPFVGPRKIVVALGEMVQDNRE